MAGYIGHSPVRKVYAVDEFTTSAAQASSGDFTLSQTVSDSKTLEVSVGGIDQPQSAYSVTGTTLAFGASIIAQNDIVIVRHAGESLMYPALEVNAVDSTNIVAGAVDDAHLATGIDSTKLTGTIVDGRIPSLDTAKITTGTFDNARISVASVTQHVPAVDLTAVRQDIAMLALYNAVSDNRAAYNLPFSFIDQFEDNTGTTTRTDVSNGGEYFASVISGAAQHTVAKQGAVTRSNTTAQFGGYSMYSAAGGQGLTFPDHADFNFGAGDFTIEYWIYPTASQNHHLQRDIAAYPAFVINSSNYVYISGNGSSWGIVNGLALGAETLNAWQHYALVREGSTFTTYKNGTRQATVFGGASALNSRAGDLCVGFDDASASSVVGYMDEVRISKGIARYSGASHVVPTAQFTPDSYTVLLLHMDDTGLTDNSGTTTNATGTLVSDVQTAPAAITKMSGVILYKDGVGTATTLGTHLIISFSANGGSNWTDLTSASDYDTLTPVFSTGVKMVKLKEKTVTSGTTPVIKAVWATQASGVRETQLHGWAMNY
jgi:hypothetical protein